MASFYANKGVSIPNSAIERPMNKLDYGERNLFQFQIVRLRVKVKFNVDDPDPSFNSK